MGLVEFRATWNKVTATHPCDVRGCAVIKRALRAIALADRAHVLTDLAMQLAPQVNLAHVITSIVNHVIAHPDLYQHVRLTPPCFAVVVGP